LQGKHVPHDGIREKVAGLKKKGKTDGTSWSYRGGALTDVLKVGCAILARMLEKDGASTRVIIQKLRHVINDAFNEQPAVFGGSMLGKLLRRNFSGRFSFARGLVSSLCLFFESCPKRLCKVQVARIGRNLSGILTLAALGHSVSKATHEAISNMAWEE
jgi:hypothetical protein